MNPYDLASKQNISPIKQIPAHRTLGDNISGSFKLGAQESVVATGMHWIGDTLDGVKAKASGEQPMSKEEFEAEGLQHFTEFKEGEFADQARMRARYEANRQRHESKARGAGLITSLGAGMLGNTLLDAPLMFIPYAKMAHSARVGTKVLQGQKISAASKTVDALSSNPISAKVVQGALAGEKTPLKAGETFFQLAKYGAVEQTIENTAVYFGSQALGRDYGMLDFAGDTVFGAGILGVLGGFQTRKLMKVGNMMARDITNSKALSILAEGGDIQAVAKHLNNYSEDVTGTFMDSVDKNPRIQAIMGMDEATFNADPAARGELQEFLGRNRAGVFFSTLKGNIPFDTRLSVVDAKRKQHAQMARITEALPDHLRGEDVSGRLTPDEMKIIHETDTKLQRLMETVGGLEPEARVDVEPEPTPRKSFVRTRQEKDTIELERLLEKGDKTIDDDLRIKALETRLEGEQKILEERVEQPDLKEGDLVVYDGYEGTLRYEGERAVIETTDGTLVDIVPEELSQVSRTAKRVAHKEGSDQIFIEGTQFRIGDPEATIQMDADGIPQKATLVGPDGAKTDITDPDVVYRVGSILHAEKVRKRRGSDIRPRREDAFDDTAYEDATLVHDWAGAWDEGTIRTVQTLEEGGHVSAEDALKALDELEAQSDFMMELPISEKRKMEVLEELYETEKVINRYLEKWTAPKASPTIPLRGEAPKVTRKTRKTRGQKLLEEGIRLKKREVLFRVKGLIKDVQVKMGVVNTSKKEQWTLGAEEIHLMKIQESFDFLGNRNHFVPQQKRLDRLLKDNEYSEDAIAFMRLEQKIFAAAAEGDVDKMSQLIEGHHGRAMDALDEGSSKASEPVFTKADSNRVIDAADRFIQALGFDVRVRAKRKDGSMAHYDGDINLDPDVRPDRALQLTFHELVHYFRETDKKVYDALSDVVDRFRGDKVFMDKILTPDVRKKYQENFKKDPMRADQKMSEEETAWFMTEATKHPEFWQALKQRDPKVFEQFKLWLRRLWDMINGNRRIDRKNMTADQKLAMRQFGEILAAAESVDSKDVTSLRHLLSEMDKLNKAESLQKELDDIYKEADRLDEEYPDRAAFLEAEIKRVEAEEGEQYNTLWQEYLRSAKEIGVDPFDFISNRGTMDALEPKSPKPMKQATSELEANMEAEVTKASEATQAKNKEAAKEVEGRAKKVSQDPLQTAKERVEAQIEGDLATIILDTNTNPETLLEKLKEVAETLGADGNPVRARYVALVERIIGFKKGTRQQYDHARGVLELEKKPDLSTTGEEGFIRLAQLQKRMETEKLGKGEALREYARWLDEDQMKRALAEINNDKVLHHNDSGLRRMRTSKGKLKYLKSFTDGLQRRGVRLFGSSIQSDVNAQITKDMSKLRSVFAKHGFLDELDNTIHRIDGESDIKATERAKARREASNMFVWDLAQYYKTGEVPSRYGDREADFKELGEALRETLHSQITQLNEYGAGIRFREDHLGLNYRWSDEVIRKMGFDEFRARMVKEADWDKIEESHGGMMVASRNDKGYADEMIAFEKEAFIRQWYDEAVSPVKPQDHPSTNIARSFGKARMIHMKPEFEQQSLIDFSGHGSLGRLLQDQIRHRSEMIAVMRNLGNEPLANFDKIVRAAGIDPNVNTTRVKSGSKLDKALVASGAAERTHKMDVNHMYKTVEFLTGASDNPASHDWSFWGKSYRQLSNMAFMWTAGVSAITDVPITLLTLEQMGADVSIPQLMGAMKRSATRRFIDKDRGELTAFFEGSGAAFDALKNAGARRLALAESNGDTFLAKGSEMMFTINGVSGWTSMMQEAFVDVLTQSLARQARSGDWDPHMRMTMRSMGFTQDDFFRLSEGVVEINGVARVGPPSFEGQDLHMKLLQFFSEYRDKAVIVPDASTQSLIRFGTQAGTWQGEAVRSVMQYASFPVAMNRVVNRMMMLNAEGRNPWTTGQIGMTRMVVFAGGMMGLAYAAMVMKDLARFRGPAMPWEMNQAVLGRLIDQAGFLGVVGNLAGAAKDGRVSSVMAPNIGTQANMLGKLSSDGFGAALYASRAYTGDSIPIIGPWITTTLAYGFQGGYAEAMRIGANFRERELNVNQWTPVPNP